MTIKEQQLPNSKEFRSKRPGNYWAFDNLNSYFNPERFTYRSEVDSPEIPQILNKLTLGIQSNWIDHENWSAQDVLANDRSVVVIFVNPSRQNLATGPVDIDFFSRDIGPEKRHGWLDFEGKGKVMYGLQYDEDLLEELRPTDLKIDQVTAGYNRIRGEVNILGRWQEGQAHQTGVAFVNLTLRSIQEEIDGLDLYTESEISRLQGLLVRLDTGHKDLVRSQSENPIPLFPSEQE